VYVVRLPCLGRALPLCRTHGPISVSFLPVGFELPPGCHYNGQRPCTPACIRPFVCVFTFAVFQRSHSIAVSLSAAMRGLSKSVLSEESSEFRVVPKSFALLLEDMKSAQRVLGCRRLLPSRLTSCSTSSCIGFCLVCLPAVLLLYR
jgi:hypothetical protein